MEPIRVVHRESRPWTVYLMLALCLVFAPIIFYLWQGHWERVPPGMPATEVNSTIAARADSQMQRIAAHAPITDAFILVAERNPRVLVGQPVLLQKVGVRKVNGEGAFWVSHVRTPPVFVSGGGKIEFGRAVTIDGKVQAAPSREEARRRWPGLSEKDLDTLAKQGVYIEALQVSVRGPF
jgi:hypothetical protein